MVLRLKNSRFQEHGQFHLQFESFSAGPFALLNFEYLLSECDLAEEDLCLGLPVLQRLDADTKTLLEEHRDRLDGSDFASISTLSNLKRAGHVSRIMIARLRNVADRSAEHGDVRGQNSGDGSEYLATKEKSANYFSSCEEGDPFPVLSIIDYLDTDQKRDAHLALFDMLPKVDQKEVSQQYQTEISQLVMDNTNLFHTSFTSGPSTKVAQSVLKLLDDAKPVRVRHGNYSIKQSEFLSHFVTRLVDVGMAYSNSAASWAYASLLVPKDGPFMFRFTVEPRPVNLCTVNISIRCLTLSKSCVKYLLCVFL